MKFLFDLFPVILFFGSFSWAKNNIGTAQSIADKYLSAFVAGPGIPESSVPILLATAFAIVASVLQIVYLFLRRKKIVLYWLFGGALLIAHVAFRKNLVRAMMEKKIRLPDSIWQKLNVAWIVFFVLMGVVNLYVAFWGGFETSTWVSFKLFGGMGLMLVFIVGQSIYLSRYLKNA